MKKKMKKKKRFAVVKIEVLEDKFMQNLNRVIKTFDPSIWFLTI